MTEQVGTARTTTAPTSPARPLTIRGLASTESGSGMYRVDLPLWALGRAGHTTKCVVGVDAVEDDVDVVIGQVIADPWRLHVWKQLAERTGRRPVLIAELDDDIWNVHGSNVAATALISDEVVQTLEESLRVADAVTVTTEHLAELVGRFNDHVYIVPNCVDGSLLEHRKADPERTTVGWTVSSSHLMDAQDIAPTLSHYLRRNPDVDLHLVGQDFSELIKAPNVRHTDWDRELTNYLHGVDFHIGLAPLMYHAFNRARSDVKALEYAVLGIPVVASHFGPYPATIVHGETGFLVKHTHEWAKYLNLLVKDVARREEMAQAARAWAATRTVQGNLWRWEQAFTDTILRVHGELGEPSAARESVSICESAARENAARESVTPAADAAAAAPVSAAAENAVAPLVVEGRTWERNFCFTYRMEMPLWALREAGNSARIFDRDLPTPSADTDVIVWQYVITPERLNALREQVNSGRNRPAAIVEIDDDYWNIDPSNPLPYNFWQGEQLRRLEEALRLADAVTVSTEHLGHIAAQFNENVYVLENCIDLSLLLHKRPVPARPTVGWGGSAGHVMDFEAAKRPLEAFFRGRPDVDLHTMGWEPPFTFPNRRHSEHIPYVMRYLESLDFHIGIAPMAPHVFNRSKSDLRILEYNALGIPVVASDFGPYAASVRHGETGFLVTRDEDWATYLGQLVDDEQLRSTMSINARLWASTRTVQGNAWKWELAYRETAARVRGGEVTGLLAPLPRELVSA